MLRDAAYLLTLDVEARARLSGLEQLPWHPSHGTDERG